MKLIIIILLLVMIIVFLRRKTKENFIVYESTMCKCLENTQCPFPPQPFYDSYF